MEERTLRRRDRGVGLELVRVKAQHNEVAVLVYEPRRPRNVTIVAGHGYSSSKHNLDFLCNVTIVAGHGYSSSKHNLDFLCAFLQSHGCRVYNFDFPGHKLGASGGTLRGFDDCIDAMSAVVARARQD